ncbi:DinB family protein [Nocardia mexicana]|uniref:DinB family protein n=1 Tax=Nocardia mexicana TaxID=279262 RepID=A0A370GM74_9NOCA|nr:DinB family protein [Nocardia mexicana]RDI44389.1 DinB family protein [Nocardia mexicana]
MDHCRECGFTYDTAAAPAAGQAIRDGIAEIANVLRDPQVNLRDRRSQTVWSPLEYACHVRDTLLVQRERVLAARRADRVDCTPMGRDERVDHDGYAEQDPRDVARQTSDAALMFTNVLARLAPEDWARIVLYNFPEPRTERTLSWVAVHTVHEVRHHLQDIRRQLTS